MTVYVDDMVKYRGSKWWCHMWASGGRQELHAMAEKIGLKRGWFQEHPVHPHYDLTESKRAMALKNGAVACSSVELIALIRKATVPE